MGGERLRYSLTFAALSVVLAASATDSAGLLALAEGWAALAAIGVAAAYAAGRPRLLGKRPDGRRNPAARLLLFPYFALSAAALRLAPAGGPAFAPVAPNLSFGRRPRRGESGAAWAAVLDLAAEFPRVAPAPRYRSLPLLDGVAPSDADLRAAVAWLREAVAGDPVLVHCALGRGRSGTVVAAYLLATGAAETVDAALARLRSVRPGVDVSPGQRRALEIFVAPVRSSTVGA